jgi:hypothetical protein
MFENTHCDKLATIVALIDCKWITRNKIKVHEEKYVPDSESINKTLDNYVTQKSAYDCGKLEILKKRKREKITCEKICQIKRISKQNTTP